MFLSLVKKELIAHLLSLRFATTFVLTLVLVFVSVFVTTGDYKRRAEQGAALQSQSEQALDELFADTDEPDEQKANRRVSVLWEGRTNAVPSSSMSTLVQGLTSEMPAAVHTSRRGSTNLSLDEHSSALAQLFHRPDMAYVIGVILSLLAILFVFDSVCGEKEDGTLRLVLSNAVPRHAVLLSKWFGGYLALIMPFVIVFIGATSLAWLWGGIEVDNDVIKRMAVLLLVAMLYVSVFFTLGLFVSTLTHRAATSLFVCLFVWVTWILVIPNLTPVMAKIIAPAPSKQKIAEEKRSKAEEISLRRSRLQLYSGELVYGNKLELEREQLDKELADWERKWDDYYDRTMRRQSEWARGLGRISPSASWVYAATELTQTGTDSYNSFTDATGKMQDEMERLRDEMEQEARANWERSRNWQWPMLDRQDVPELRMTQPSFEASVENALNDVLILAILNIVFFMASFLSFLRYDVR